MTNTDITQIAEENCMTEELDACAKGDHGVRPTTELIEKAAAFARS